MATAERDVVITLVSEFVGAESDDTGNTVAIEQRRDVFAKLLSIKRSEFYQAQAVGLYPTVAFEVYRFEYNAEKIVEHEGVKYNVLRTYPIDGERLEIICNDIAR